MEKSLIVIRGLPGSGKSTFAQLISNKDACICTSDDYFMKDGSYQFDITKLSLAHDQCRNKCEQHMKSNLNKIIVANTSTTEQEMAVYFDLAKKYGYSVFSVIMENRHEGKSVHGVPDTTLEKMRNRFSIKL